MSASRIASRSRRRPRPATLVLAVGGLAGVAALGVSATAGAATPSPSPSTPSTPSATSSAPATGAPDDNGSGPDRAGNGRPGWGGPGKDGPGRGGPGEGGAGRGGPGRGGPGGVVTAISASSLTVKSPAGTSKTYTLNSATKYHAGPDTTGTRGDIAVGDRVAVHTSSSTSSTATDVDERLPHLDGTVVRVSGGTITITDMDGFQRTVDTTATTKYTKGGSSASSSAVTTGAHIHASGKVDADKTSLDATTVDVAPTVDMAPMTS